METNTVKVSNLSAKATDHDIRDFFSFSGEIEHIDIQSESDRSNVAWVTFKYAEALDTAILLSGATIVDQIVSIIPVEDYHSPTTTQDNAASLTRQDTSITESSGSAITKAQDVMTNMLAKGFILGKDAMSKAKAFDEKHQLTANATARVSSFDKKIGLSQKFSAGTAVVNERVKAMDQKYQVSEKTKSAFAVAEQKVNNAGSAILKNKYVFTSTSWVAGAFSRVAKAAGEVGQKTKEKVQQSEGQKEQSPSSFGSD